ncbi:MAG: hypothetical protein AAB834_01765 [Patescibacteria group bacterium]
MQKTIFAILTNQQVRNTRIVEMILDQEFTVGAPWFDKTQVEFPGTKTDVAL